MKGKNVMRNEYGPLAARDLQIRWRDENLRNKTKRDMTFCEQRRFLDMEYLKQR